jgi:hypothetical protein
LFQAKPGQFQFSQQFRNLYKEIYGTDPDSSHHRVGNTAAAEVYCRLGTAASSGERAYIRLATVPAEAATAIEILIEADGEERANINAHQSFCIKGRSSGCARGNCSNLDYDNSWKAMPELAKKR